MFMREFEETAEVTIPQQIQKLLSVTGGESDKKKKQVDRVNKQVSEIYGKYNRHKSDFVLNGKMKNAASFVGTIEGG